MRIFIAILSIFFLVSCGGGGGRSSAVADKDAKTDTKDKIEETTKEKAKEETKPIIEITDAFFNEQWYLERNNAYSLLHGIDYNAHIHSGNYLKIYKGEGVKIAVIDNSIYTSHEDLVGRVANIGEYDGGTNYGHGTGVFGLIGANANNIGIYGIANKSKIYAIKLSETGSDLETIENFQKAVNYGADIINCSWGNYHVSEAVKSYIEDLAKNGRDGKGILIVFASGNDSKDLDSEDENGIIEDQSEMSGVFGVGASNTKNKMAYYSNYGSNLDLVAPGGDIDNYPKENGVLTLSSDNQYIYGEGTSYSAPIVSGVFALMLEANPNLTRDQVMQIIKDTSDKIGNDPYDLNGHNNKYGYGKINAKKAIEASLKLK